MLLFDCLDLPHAAVSYYSHSALQPVNQNQELPIHLHSPTSTHSSTSEIAHTPMRTAHLGPSGV